MGNVYIVSKRLFKKAYNAEPFKVEYIAKVFDDYHKVVSYICDAIKEDHEKVDYMHDDPMNVHKYIPNPDGFEELIFITSYDYSNDHYYEKVNYVFRSHDVE